MDSLDSNLAILDVQFSEPKRNDTTQRVANLPGYTVSDTYVEDLTVTITFELHIYNIADRNAACQKVNAWAANGGTLTTNERPGQYLQNVRCVKFANINSSKNWTDPLTIVFSTTNSPYFRSNQQKTLTLTGKNTSGNLVLDGNTSESLVSVTATAAQTVKSIQFTVGSTTLKLTGLNIPASKQIIVDYTGNRILRIRGNGSSIMARLDPSSSDNLLAKCGASTKVSVVSDGKVTAVFAGRGCWL